MEPPTDELLGPISAGDADAFGRFLARVELTVRASLRPYATLVDVEAVFQEAALRLWQVAPRLEPDGKPEVLLRYFVRIAKNAAIDELRRRRDVPLPDDDRPLEQPVTMATPDPLLREVITRCFEKLPTQPSVALRARLQCEGADSDAALAERCQMKPNTFLQNVGRARKLLLECLEGRGVDLAFLGATP